MRIIEVSEDQNTVKTDDGKEHEFVEDNNSCMCDYCSLQEVEYNDGCELYCRSDYRIDEKEGFFKLKLKEK